MIYYKHSNYIYKYNKYIIKIQPKANLGIQAKSVWQRMNKKVIRLNQILADKQQNRYHLETPNFQSFIKFCQQHQLISEILGGSKVCRRSTLLCNKCQRHKLQDSRHDYYGIRDLARFIKNIKSKYREYHNLYVNQIIPEFLSILKIVILQFMQGIQKWNKDTVLLGNFLYFSKNKRIQQILTSQIQQWDLNSFTCRDMEELIQIHQKVMNDSPQKVRQNIYDDLKQLLSRSMMNYELIPIPIINKKQQQQMSGSIQNLLKKLTQLQTRLQKFNKLDIKNRTILTVRLTEQTVAQNCDYVLTALKKLECNKTIQQLSVQKQRNKGTDKQSRIEALLQQQKQKCKQQKQNYVAEVQQEINRRLGTMINRIYEYLRRCHHPIVKMILKIPSEGDSGEFWEFLFDKLVSLADQISLSISPKALVQNIIISCVDHKILHQKFLQFINRNQKEHQINEEQITKLQKNQDEQTLITKNQQINTKQQIKLSALIDLEASQRKKDQCEKQRLQQQKYRNKQKQIQKQKQKQQQIRLCCTYKLLNFYFIPFQKIERNKYNL